jgi:hypothetical protein
MSRRKLPAIIQSILDSRRLEAGEAMTLRRWFYGDGIVHQEDAEALFRANAALAGRCEEFNALFVQAVADFVVYQQLPTGRVTRDQATWLIGEMGGPGARIGTVGELRLILEILEEAHEIPASLGAFALEQVKHAGAFGAGGAGLCRPPVSCDNDAGDVATLCRLLEAAGGAEGAAMTDEDADLLVHIAAPRSDPRREEAWDRLYVRTIASHLLATHAARSSAATTSSAAAGSPPDDVLVAQRSPRRDGGSATWLARRVHRDDEVTSAGGAVLAVAEGETAAPLAEATIIRLS